jgi:L-iditol 2-dehydrogenase
LAKSRGLDHDIEGRRLREGDLVVFFDVHRTCGRCHACTVARTPTRCAARRVYGITDPAGEGLYGGWSEAIYLEPGVVMARLPDAVRPEDYIGAGCGLVTAVHALERMRLQLADTVVVQGVGAVGLSVVALSRLSGASTIIAVGGPADRLALAQRMGADLTLDIERTTAEQRRERVLQATAGRGADVAVEAAGAARAIEEAPLLLRDGGTYVVAGHYTNAGESTINAHEHVNRKHLDIRGCWGSEAAHFIRALRVLERHASHVPWRDIEAATYALDDINDALAAAEAMRVPKALVRPNTA